MAVQIAWKIEGEKQLSRALLGFKRIPKDMKKPFQSSANKLQKVFEREVFSTRGSAIGESWRPLSPVTLARKARSGFPADPLVATGKMKRSFYNIASTDSAVIGNRASYFKYHQSNKPRTKLPRRVMMKLHHNQREMVIKEFQKYLRESLRK